MKKRPGWRGVLAAGQPRPDNHHGGQQDARPSGGQADRQTGRQTTKGTVSEQTVRGQRRRRRWWRPPPTATRKPPPTPTAGCGGSGGDRQGDGDGDRAVGHGAVLLQSRRGTHVTARSQRADSISTRNIAIRARTAESESQTGRQTGRQTNRQTRRPTDRQTDRQTDGRTDLALFRSEPRLGHPRLASLVLLLWSAAWAPLGRSLGCQLGGRPHALWPSAVALDWRLLRKLHLDGRHRDGCCHRGGSLLALAFDAFFFARTARRLDSFDKGSADCDDSCASRL
jgi:hypothetical protein